MCESGLSVVDKKYELSLIFSNYNAYKASLIHLIQTVEAEKAGYKFRWGIPAAAMAGVSLESLVNFHHYCLFDNKKQLRRKTFKNKIVDINTALCISLPNTFISQDDIDLLIQIRNKFVHPMPFKATVDYIGDPNNIPRYKLPGMWDSKPEERFTEEYTIEYLKDLFLKLDRLETLWIVTATRLGKTQGFFSNVMIKPK